MSSNHQYRLKQAGTYNWLCAGSCLNLGPGRPLVMGILNVTPDSFSDGGSHSTPEAALRHAEKMLEEGADIIDVGGESTRPGAAPVTADEEAARTLPVIKALAGLGAIVSIDTTKSTVAAAAIDAGARIINDVSACSADRDMLSTAAVTGAGLILMHMQGEPKTMQAAPAYKDVVREVLDYLSGRADSAVSAGVSRNSILLDPGIGFGKTVEHNLSLLAHLDALSAAGLPVMIGISRKSFIGKITGRDVNERLAGSLAGLIWCIIKGVHVVRVHDVQQTVDAVKIIRALKEAE